MNCEVFLIDLSTLVGIAKDWQFVEAEKKCIYCSSESDLHKEHIVPKSLRIRPDCETCDVIQGIHNQIWACSICNSAKGAKGYPIFDFRF